GDPKQSIYGWRNADLEAYERMLSRVRDAGGCVGTLAVNHRSVPAIPREVERVGAPVMGREPGLQPAFEPLAPSAARAAGPGVRARAVTRGSVPAIPRGVERGVAPVMGREPGLQPAFEPLAPSAARASALGFRAGGRAPVEFWLPADCDKRGAPRATRAAD